MLTPHDTDTHPTHLAIASPGQTAKEESAWLVPCYSASEDNPSGTLSPVPLDYKVSLRGLGD